MCSSALLMDNSHFSVFDYFCIIMSIHHYDDCEHLLTILFSKAKNMHVCILQHCLSGWSNPTLNSGSQMSSLDLRGSMTKPAATRGSFSSWFDNKLVRHYRRAQSSCSTVKQLLRLLHIYSCHFNY